MNEGLDTSIALATLDEKPSKQYRSSPYTVREYAALPYCSRLSVDLTCDEQEGITYATHTDETSEKPYTVGRRATTAPQAIPQPSSPQPAMFLTEAPAAPLAPAQAQPAQMLQYNIATVVNRHYVNLTASDHEPNWTHWGYSPFLGGTEQSFAVNERTGAYKCFLSERTGTLLDLVMFMEEVDEPVALAWLGANSRLEPSATEVAHENEPLPAEPEALPEIGIVADGPSCAYPGLPQYGPITMQPAPEASGESDFAALTEATSQAAMRPAAESSEPVAVEGIIYHTTNYDLFKIIDENRLLKEAGVRRLVRQITRKNLLHARPIDVSPDMEVLDGQHRLAAAKELGLPVYYKIEPELTKEDITVLNVAQTNWAPTDYLHNWTVKGVPDYVAMSDFMKRHPIVSFSNAKVMLGTTQKHNVEEFREGKWKVGDIARAERVAELIERLDNEVSNFKQAGHTQFVSAIFYCMTGLKGFDPQEFMRTVLLQPRSLVPCTSHKQFLQMFQEIYNYRKAEANRLKFL